MTSFIYSASVISTDNMLHTLRALQSQTVFTMAEEMKEALHHKGVIDEIMNTSKIGCERSNRE